MCVDDPPGIEDAVDSSEEMMRDLARRQGVNVEEYRRRLEAAGLDELDVRVAPCAEADRILAEDDEGE